MTNAPAITAFLLAHFGQAQTAGIMGNMRVETGSPDFPTGAIGYNDGGPGVNAIGICQWEGGRRNNLQAWAAGRNSSETDLNTQLTFFMHEITTSYSLVYQSINAMHDPASVAAEVDAHYEVSDGSARQQRIDHARAYYADIQAGKVPEAGGKVPNVPGTNSPIAGHPVPGASQSHPDPHAPFLPPSILRAPLSADQKLSIGNYIKSAGGYPDSAIAQYTKNGDYDTKLIEFYTLVATGGVYNFDPSGVSTPLLPNVGGLLSWTHYLTTALSWLTTLKNWERIGLFVLGAAILLFAAIELFHVNVPGLPG